MTQDPTKPFLEMINRFGADLSLPKLDLDKLVEFQRKNIDALSRAAVSAGEGAQALAARQREILETAFREATQAVRDFKPDGDAATIAARQSEFARKAFETTLQNARDIAEHAGRAVADPATIVKDRMRESLKELRDGVVRSGGAKS
jgi:phasin family protein